MCWIYNNIDILCIYSADYFITWWQNEVGFFKVDIIISIADRPGIIVRRNRPIISEKFLQWTIYICKASQNNWSNTSYNPKLWNFAYIKFRQVYRYRVQVRKIDWKTDYDSNRPTVTLRSCRVELHALKIAGFKILAHWRLKYLRIRKSVLLLCLPYHESRIILYYAISDEPGMGVK